MTPDALSTFVKQFLTTLGIDATVEVTTGHPVSTTASSRGGRTVAKVSSPDAATLIGPNGEHLRALNMLAKRMVEHAHGEEAAGFLIDINGWHETQLEQVREQARMLAQRARLFKHDVEMPPLSAYERLVVHELFSEDPEIKTESAGEGKFRHIVLKYKTAV